MKHLGSSIAITFGILSFVAGINITLRHVQEGYAGSGVANTNIGIILILGGLAYRSSKVRRMNWSNYHVIRIVFEIIEIGVILFILFGAGQDYFNNQIINDPVWPLTGIFAILAWLISNLLPKLREEQRIQNMVNKIEPQIVDNGKREPTSSNTRLLIRSGLYRAEGAEFRIYSSGRVSLLKSDIKPLGDETNDFKSIGWFLRAFPDIDISLVKRLSD